MLQGNQGRVHVAIVVLGYGRLLLEDISKLGAVRSLIDVVMLLGKEQQTPACGSSAAVGVCR